MLTFAFLFMKFMNKKTFYFALLVIIILSFRFYASNFYPALCTDDAVIILMLHNFSLPHDIYFWGQDRYGSLIPLLGQFFFKLFKLSAVSSESITHYILLIAGYFGFAGLFQSYSNKFIFAIIWFFPPFHLIDFIRNNLGIQYALIGIAVFALNELYASKTTLYSLKQHLLLLLCTIVLILSIWVSDLSIVTIFILLCVLFFFYLKEHNFAIGNKFYKKPELYYIVFGLLTTVFFIHYAKSHADKIENYEKFNDFNAIIASIKIFCKSICELFTFKSHELFTSIYLYLILIVSGLCLFNFRFIKLNDNNKKWLIFFMIDGVIAFSVIMLSKWSYLNGVPRRYFIPVYISLWIAFLIILEHLQLNIRLKKYIEMILITAVIIGGIGTLYNFKYVLWIKTLEPRIKTANEFKSLGNIGIIADYWYSYINACPDPDMIKATPNESSYVRNRKLADDVFKQNKLYVIKDNWLDSFPDSLKQFGHLLLKDGEQFYLGGSDVCKYKEIK